MVSKVNIRPYRNEDITVLLEITSEEGWNVSEIDCKASLDVDRKGLIVAEDDSGTPVGFIGLFNMSSNITYLDVFIVRRNLRGKGIGRKLWEAMITLTKDNILVLDSVSSMKEWYNAQGFSYEAYCAKFYQGTISSDEAATSQNRYNIIPLSDDIWSALIAYDKQIYPYSRERSLRAWFCGAGKYSVVAFLDNCVVGYANYHWKSEKECSIRALYADNDAISDALLVNLRENIPLGSFVTFLLLEDKPLPKYFLNFKSTITIHRLFTKEMFGIRTERVIIAPDHMV